MVAQIVHPKLNTGKETVSLHLILARRVVPAECGCSVEPVARTNRRTAPTLHVPFAAVPRPPVLPMPKVKWELRRRELDARQGGFKGPKQLFLLPDDRLRRGQLLFQSQSGLRLGQAQQTPATGEFDEVKLNFIAVNHDFILLEIRRIATGD